MGNNNSISPEEKYCESIECPICLEEHTKYITLNCGHKFDYYCIQMHLYTKFIAKEKLNCPYCRVPICKKNINDLWNKWIIIDYKSDFFSKNIILNINKYLKLTKINKIEYNTDINFNTILMPLFFGKPAFLITPVVNDSNVLYNDKVVELSHLLSKYKTEHGETLENYNFIMDCYITDKKWRNFLTKINKLFKMNTFVNSDYNEKLKYSEYKIRLYINNVNNIKTLDNYYGSLDNKLHYYKNRKFKCIFKMFLIKNEYDFYLVNELHSIIY